MKKYRILWSIISVLVLLNTSCSTLHPIHEVQGDAGKKEKTELVMEEKLGAKETLGAVLLPVAAEIGKDLVRFAGKAGADELRSVASQYEAAYDAKDVRSDFSQEVTMRVGYKYLFHRQLIFSNETDACSELGVTHLLQLPTGTVNHVDGNIAVDVLQFRFIMRVAPGGRSMRFEPTRLVYIGSKAKIVDLPIIHDKADLAFVFKVNEAFELDGQQIERSSEPAQFKIAISRKNMANTFDGDGDKPFAATDWIPTPSTATFSLQVTALESSGLAKWLKKAADKLGSSTDKLGDTLSDKLKKLGP
jgi:hypothetical protein